MLYGSWGKVLEIDIGRRETEVIKLPEEIYNRFIGGRGLGVYLYTKYARPLEVDPLSAGNPIIIATGPLTGCKVPAAGWASMTSRSPLTRTIFTSNSGGVFGALLKFTGYDAIIISGRSDKPVYIYLNEKEIRIEDALPLWGKNTQEVSNSLKKKYSSQSSVASIGQAGERQVLFASVITDGGRGFCRGGLGAIWGYKNLKAIVVQGSQKPRVREKEKLNDLVYEAEKSIKQNPITSKALPELGTSFILDVLNFEKALPVKNFSENKIPFPVQIGSSALQENILVKTSSCWRCPIFCGRVSKDCDGKIAEGPDFETIWAMGPNIGINDLPFIQKVNILANEFGLDTISLGGVIAFAMEATEKEIVDFGIRFGEKEKIIELIDLIVKNEGVGQELRSGTAYIGQKFGKKAQYFALNVKGLELPGYDPRVIKGMAIGFATSNRGACHLHGGYSVGSEIFGLPRKTDPSMQPSKGTLVAKRQNDLACEDSLIICHFAGMGVSLEIWSEILSVVTGKNFSAGSLSQIGERIHNLERMINIHFGFTRKDDTLPAKLREEQMGVENIDLEGMLDEYYEFRGWNKDGVPSQRKIKELELEGIL